MIPRILEHGVTWSSKRSKTGARSADDGATNTDMIIAALPDDNPRNNAAHLCRSYIDPIEGHTDWYLPSKNELNKMYLYAKANNLIGRNCSGSIAGGVQCLIGGITMILIRNIGVLPRATASILRRVVSGTSAMMVSISTTTSKFNGRLGARATRAFNNSTIQQFNNLLLRGSSKVEALIAIAKNQESDVEDLRFVLGHSDLDSLGLAALAASRNSDSELLADIISHPLTDVATLLAVAQNPATNLIGLTEVIHHSNVNAEILEAVAAHSNADADLRGVIETLQAPDHHVAGAAAAAQSASDPFGYTVSVGDSFGGGTVFCVSQTEDITKCVAYRIWKIWLNYGKRRSG